MADPLEQNESRHLLNFAEGWLGLGNLVEAEVQLAQIEGRDAENPGVITCWWELSAARRDWEGALGFARKLILIAPESPAGWIQQSFSLRRLPDRGLVAAFEALEPAAAEFPEEPIIPYNLACYQCQLGDHEAALQFFRASLERGDRSVLLEMAKSDPDLTELLPQLKKL